MTDLISLLISAAVQLALFCLIPFIWWLVTARRTNFFRWMGLKRPEFAGAKWKIFGIILAGALAYIAAMYLMAVTLLRGVQTAASQFAGKGLAAIPAILVYAMVQTSLSEELFFRGFLCKRFAARLGFKAGNLLQAVLFGLCHGIPFGLATGNWLVCILLTALPTGIGCLQGWLNERKAGGSIVPSWMLHGLMNLLSALATI